MANQGSKYNGRFIAQWFKNLFFEVGVMLTSSLVPAIRQSFVFPPLSLVTAPQKASLTLIIFSINKSHADVERPTNEKGKLSSLKI